jgi:hypothetical protein
MENWKIDFASVPYDKEHEAIKVGLITFNLTVEKKHKLCLCFF